MFNTYEEAKSYAKRMDEENPHRKSIVLTKDGKYNVAKNWVDAEYGIECGWEVVYEIYDSEPF